MSKNCRRNLSWKKSLFQQKNSTEAVWEKGEWDDYFYDGKCFVVVKDHSWVGIYNMDCIMSIIVK